MHKRLELNWRTKMLIESYAALLGIESMYHSPTKMLDMMNFKAFPTSPHWPNRFFTIQSSGV